MKRLAITTIILWIVFPVAPLRAGLSRRGFSLLQEANLFRGLFNLACGLAMAWLAISYQQGGFDGIRLSWPTERAAEEFLDRAYSSEAISGPFEAYTAFWPTLIEQVQGWWYYSNMNGTTISAALSDLWTKPLPSIFGVTITGGWAALLLLASPLIAWVLFTELRVLLWRLRFQIHYRFAKNSFSTPGGVRSYDVRGALTGSCHLFGLRHSGLAIFFEHLTRKHGWLTDRVLFEYFLGDVFLVVAGVITPMIAFPFLIILLIPLALTVGVWLLAIVLLLLGLIPFAFLHANGMRVRMH